MDELEITDAELDSLVDTLHDLEDIEYAYDEDEFESVNESIELNEIMSRTARIQAKFRMKRTKTKRLIKKKLALKRRSNNDVLKRRARKIAINLMKKKLLKKDLSTASFADKVRVETLIKKRKGMIDRLSRKLIPKVRQIEQKRMAGPKQ